MLERLRVDFTREQEPWLTADEIPAFVREAILHQEDRRLASHSGVDPLALAGAVRDSIVIGKRRGASTLAMQDARLVFPSLRRLPLALRKVAEGIIALGLTAHWGRDGVLEVWSNLVPMPGSRRGLPTAARTWMGADLSTLSREEAGRLVMAARRPGRERETASSTRFFKRDGRQAPFADESRVPLLLQSLLVKNDDQFPAEAKAEALRRGRVRTTIDGSLQTRIELLARDERARLAQRNVGDLAVVVVDNATGNIVASVGNTARLGDADAWIDNAHARRQAGSSLKPFLYALALEKGLLRSDTHLSDEPYERVKPGGTYRPRNYDGVWHGAVPAAVALASSLNVPALRVLDLVGQEAFAARLEALGFEVDEAPGVLGESVALGTLDVTLEQLASAYTTLARGGLRVSLRSLIGDFEDDGHLDGDLKETRVMGEASAREVAGILASDANRSLGFGTHSPLSTSMGASVKTGTSVDMRDNWCVGFSRRHTVAVWAGNPDGQPMWDVSGVEGAAPLWHDVMELLDGNGWSKQGQRELSARRAQPPPRNRCRRRCWLQRRRSCVRASFRPCKAACMRTTLDSRAHLNASHWKPPERSQVWCGG